MKIKFFPIVCIVLFLTSCGSKKKVISTTKKEKEVVEVVTPKDIEVIKNTPPKTYSEIKQDYIEQYSEIAIQEMKLYKIPASITLAQGVLESRSGTSVLTRKSNNHFGIKCHKSWKGKKTSHDDDEKGECFRVYKHPRSSYRDHSLFLFERTRYKDLFKLKITDYKGWARGLRKAGYATDKAYPKKLIKIIEDYELYKYDELALGKTTKQVKQDSHIVVKGDTLYSISRRYGLTVDKLKKINRFTDNKISIGQKLYVTK